MRRCLHRDMRHEREVLAGLLGCTGGEESSGHRRGMAIPLFGQDLKRKQNSKDSISIYAVQCNRCVKWRKIPTKEEFETIREIFDEDPWFCGKDPSAGRSCQQPEDIPYDSSRIWVMDRPGIPRPPPETLRLVIMRGDLSKMDTYYLMPHGKRARAIGDVEKFLRENPRYRATLSVSRFCFSTPSIVKKTVGKSSLWRGIKAERERFEMNVPRPSSSGSK